MGKFALFQHNALKAGLHWDLRYEIPESKNWVSYSFRKDPSTIKQGEKFTCIRTNDHSEKEALFVGTIPKGEYGAGILKKIDSGDCDVLNFKATRMAVTFHGTKLKGSFHFINVSVFGSYKDFKKKMFMFFKAKIGVEENFNLIESKKLEWSFKGSSISLQDIQKIEKVFDITFPVDFKDCVLKNNGGQPEPAEFSTKGNIKSILRCLYSFSKKDGDEYILKIYEKLKNHLQPYTFPFAEDPGGNLICFKYKDLKDKNPSVVFADHEDWNKNDKIIITLISNSFKEFLNSLH